MMTGRLTASRLLLPVLIAVFAVIAAVGAGVGQPSDKAEAVTTQLTIGLDMKSSSAGVSTYDINSLPTFEKCVDVSTSVSGGVFYVDIFVLNAPNLFTFQHDMVFDVGELSVLGADVKKMWGSGSTINNFSDNITSAPSGDNNISPPVNDGTFQTSAVDTGGTHPGHGVLARLKLQATTTNVTTFAFSTVAGKGVYLVADPGATHPGDTNGDTLYDGPFINQTATIATNQPDGDSDTVSNTCDNCPTTSNVAQTNTDGDTLGDACDPDDDNDTIADGSDNCPLVYNPTQDPSACQDTDGDGILDGLDNCPTTSNANQANNDNDTLGDVCDPDDDNDGVADVTDNCDFAANPTQANWNGNALGDHCEDSDLDNWLDSVDNCKSLANPSQGNSDNDNYGDTCDNCPTVKNNTQADVDSDFVGDACDDSDGDTWMDDTEIFTGTNRLQKCAVTTTAGNENPDPSPPDFNDDRRYNTLDLIPYVTTLNSMAPGPPYVVRNDLNMDNRINTLDLVRFTIILNTNCVP